MSYKVIVNFEDLQTGHFYYVGDTYPFEGEVEAKRVKQLEGDNPHKIAFIQAEAKAPAKPAPKKAK